MTNTIVGKASAPGTCGELVEGTENGKDFLITCPVDLWSQVTVVKNSSSQEKNFYKTDLAIQKAVKKLTAEDLNLSFTRKSQLLVGKGMGSSTADIAAAVQAVYRAFGKEAESKEIADLALQIEPSDALMYPGICSFDHKKGSICRYLGEPAAIDIVVVDPGGEIDTVKFNSSKTLQNLNYRKEPRVIAARKNVQQGIQENDVEKIGKGATISAVANQEILNKPYLETIIKLSQEIKALGVNIAHSGTVMGILLSPEISDKEEVAQFIKKKFSWCNVFTTKLISGGVR